MSTNFPSEFFTGNRRKLRTLLEDQTVPIILTANGLLQQSTDSTYPFKQDGNFWYLTGVNVPDVILVIDKDREYLILPEQSDYQQHFNGALDENKLTKISGIAHVLSQEKGNTLLHDILGKAKKVATLTPSPKYIAEMGFYTNPSRKSSFLLFMIITVRSNYLIYVSSSGK